MTSQGQRFRRRALRRGYKVDEVDVFLDRVEATLNSERVDAPVRSEEVRDVVFRVRFGGYDEWQVDLHLDRVERQLADQEPATFGGDRIGDRAGDRMAERLPERMPSGGMAGSMGGPGMSGMPGPAMAAGMGGAAAFDRGPGDRPDRPQLGVSQRDLPPRGDMPSRIELPPRGEMPRDPRETSPRDLPPRGGEMPRDDRMMPPGANRPPMGPPLNPQQPGWPEPSGPPQRPPFPGFPGDRQAPADRPLPERQAPPPPLPTRPTFGGDYGSDQYDNEPTFAGFEPGRRGRPDMTGELRLPDLHQTGPAAGGPPPPMGPTNQAPSGPPMGGGAPSGEADRIDQLRRTFQLRRFGSGYDRGEVDRLFDGLIGAMSGRGSMQISDSELDPQQFSLVPGGYFESEVDQALREIREIIRRR